MKLKIIEKALLIALLLAVTASFSGFASTCETLPDSVLRLHVLANSNSQEDQDLKLAVRDHLLQKSAALMNGVSGMEEAIETARAALPELKQAAIDEIRRQGYTYDVSLSVENVYFPTREYGTTTLPAGRYDALRVIIGEGKGENWWCVLFPALCLPVAEDTPSLEETLSPGELDTVQGGEKYEIRFKLWEIYEWIRENWFL